MSTSKEYINCIMFHVEIPILNINRPEFQGSIVTFDLGQVKRIAWILGVVFITTVKSQLLERRLSETTGLFEDDGQSRLCSLLSIAIKLPIIQISNIRKIQFFEVIRRSRLKRMLLNYPSGFEVKMSRMMIMISLFGRVRFTHLGDLEKKVETGN